MDKKNKTFRIVINREVCVCPICGAKHVKKKGVKDDDKR